MNKFIPAFFAATASAFLLIDTARAQAVVRDAEWVEARVQEIAVKKEERRLDDIGWAKDIREAKRLAAENRRPVFLFTHDGRLNIGRC